MQHWVRVVHRRKNLSKQRLCMRARACACVCGVCTHVVSVRVCVCVSALCVCVCMWSVSLSLCVCVCMVCVCVCVCLCVCTRVCVQFMCVLQPQYCGACRGIRQWLSVPQPRVPGQGGKLTLVARQF